MSDGPKTSSGQLGQPGTGDPRELLRPPVEPGDQWRAWATLLADRKAFRVRGLTWFRSEVRRDINYLVNFIPEMLAAASNLPHWREPPFDKRELYSPRQIYEAANLRPLRFTKAAQTVLLCEIAAKDMGISAEVVQNFVCIEPAVFRISDFTRDVMQQAMSIKVDFVQTLRRECRQESVAVFFEMADGKTVSLRLARQVSEILKREFPNLPVGDVVIGWDRKYRSTSLAETIDGLSDRDFDFYGSRADRQYPLPDQDGRQPNRAGVERGKDLKARPTNSALVSSITVTTHNFVDSVSIEEAEALFQRAEELAAELGYEITIRGPLVQGSWWQQIKYKFQNHWSERQLKDRSEAVESVLFGHANVDIDHKVVEMTAKLVSSLAGQSSSAVIDSGLFLFIKLPDGNDSFHIFAKRLTLNDRAALDEDPTIVQAPAMVLSRLRDARKVSPQRVAELQNLVAIHAAQTDTADRYQSEQR